MRAFSIVKHNLMIFFVIFSLSILLFFSWQLYRAKQFTKFKRLIEEEVKPLLIEAVKKELIEQRNEVFPNTDQHIDLSIKFWTASHARILQAAIERELITQDWITKTGNYRNCQHLFFIEKAYLLAPERVK